MTSSHSLSAQPVLYNRGVGPTANATAAHELYQEVWSSLVTSAPGGEVFDRDGVLITSAGGKWPVMNTAFLSTPVATEADLQNRISVAKQYFAEKRSLWIFILFNDWLDYSIQSEQVFSSGGLLHMQDCIGMQTTNLIKPTTPPPELSFRLVESATERFEFSDINADSYGFPSDWTSDIASWASQWPSRHIRLYIAYSGDEPVSTAMVYLIKDVAYLGFVATRRRYQRKGYAEAIARYALTTTNERQHFAKSVLHSTPAALSLYRTLGYSEVTTFGIYLGSCE
jgi:ribosomal protein S18 acetylase RimI-like enzyme